MAEICLTHSRRDLSILVLQLFFQICPAELSAHANLVGFLSEDKDPDSTSYDNSAVCFIIARAFD